MTPAAIRKHCLSLPGAKLSIKWGDDQCYTIGEKMFAAHGPKGEGLSFKCSPDVFDMLIDRARNSGIRAVIATHNMELAHKMDRILELKQGQLKAY